MQPQLATASAILLSNERSNTMSNGDTQSLSLYEATTRNATAQPYLEGFSDEVTMKMTVEVNDKGNFKRVTITDETIERPYWQPVQPDHATYMQDYTTIFPRKFYSRRELDTFLDDIRKRANRDIANSEIIEMLQHITKGRPYELAVRLDITGDLAERDVEVRLNARLHRSDTAQRSA